MLIIVTLIAIDVGFSQIKTRSKFMARLLDGGPPVLVEDGRPLEHRMKEARVTEADIMEAARSSQGVLDLSSIRYAILERNGSISIIGEKLTTLDLVLSVRALVDDLQHLFHQHSFELSWRGSRPYAGIR